MYSKSLIAISIFLLCLFYHANSQDGILSNGVNGGINCATCTIVVGLIEKLTVVHNESVVSSIERLCNYLPTQLRSYCKIAVEFLGPVLIDGLEAKETPDVICHSLKFCTNDPNQPQCHLSPPPTGFSQRAQLLRSRHSERIAVVDHYDVKQVATGRSILTLLSDICQYPGISEICKLIENVFNNHKPLIDMDNDMFGVESSLRGSAWRGKDCNDFSASARPGAKASNDDATLDHNCNGILGINSDSGRAYEKDYCNETNRMGIAVLGDSISAHFHIPEEWLDASMFSKPVFEHMWYILENELDWPQLSATTGHINITWPNIAGKTRSIYQRLFERDHCNHRDYQNIAVNGARSGSMIDISKSLTRDQINDAPLLVIYSLVGNDVCNGHPDTIDHMTKPDEMKANVLKTLAYLDTTLPKGSHVLTTGLANGSLLYDLLHDRVHPYGRVGYPVTYREVYDYLSCLQISPCNGWLSSNGTLRDLTTQRAVDLSEAVKEATMSYTAKNFDSDYLDFPFETVLNEWTSQGGEAWQLIEAVDGFHINQYGHATVSDVFWNWLNTVHPQWLSKQNPYNQQIETIFKDQGGYN